MEGWEIDACLKSFEILVDTREQPSERANRRYSQFGCNYRKTTLNYGDYTYNLRLPDGRYLLDLNEPVKGHAVIERKMSLEELSGCFTQSRDRFAREFQRAIDNGAKIYLLTENATWEKLLNSKYDTRFNSKAYLASITAFMARYDISPIFCKEEISGRLIKEILYRECKERLERGDYG